MKMIVAIDQNGPSGMLITTLYRRMSVAALLFRPLASCLTAAMVACSDVTDCYAGSISALYDVNWNTTWV